MKKNSMFLLTVLAFSSVFLTGCGDQKPSTMNVAATCSDGKMNGDESGVDCGGSCKVCADPAVCQIPSQCSSGVCMSGKCMPPTCDDGVQNQGEVGTDCGGPCKACGTGNPDMVVNAKCPFPGEMPKSDMDCLEPYVYKEALLDYRWGINGNLTRPRELTYFTDRGAFAIGWGGNDGLDSGALIASGKDCWGSCGTPEERQRSGFKDPTLSCFRLRMTDEAGQYLIIEEFSVGKDPFTSKPDRTVKAEREDTFP
ncbi:MAG: hypothetical protein Q7N87_00270 [Candidatus Uhrbacteria bacterium]|nr:hypothetical protein [Candidatus Uhrbacteria bacterium]